jgi:hypothetical protein
MKPTDRGKRVTIEYADEVRPSAPPPPGVRANFRHPLLPLWLAVRRFRVQVRGWFIP